jgi:O-antigen/teichoic acid export membrane protein
VTSAPSAQRVTRNIAWSALSSVGSQGLAMGVFMITSRLLSKESFGVVAICLLTVELVKRMTIESAITSTMSDPDATDAKFNACFALNVGLGLAGAAVSVICSSVLARLSNSPKIAEVMPVCGLLLVLLGASRTYDAWFSRHLEFRILAVRTFVSIFLGGLAGVLCAYSGLKLWSLIVQQFVNLFTALMILAYTCDWRPRLPRIRDVLQLIMRAAPISSSVAWSFLAAETDVYFSSYLLGPIVTGVYSASKRLVLAANLSINHPLASVMLPTFAATRDDDRRRQLFLRGTSLVALVTAPIFVGLAIVANDFVVLALGEKWRDAGPVLTIMSLGGFVFSLAQFTTAIFFSSSKTHFETRFNILQAVLSISLIVAVGKHGPVNIALCVLSGTLVTLPLRLLLAGSLVDVTGPQLLRALSVCVVPTLAMSFASLQVSYMLAADPVWLRLSACVLIGASAYLGVALFTSRGAIMNAVASIKR